MSPIFLPVCVCVCVVVLTSTCLRFYLPASFFSTCTYTDKKMTKFIFPSLLMRDPCLERFSETLCWIVFYLFYSQERISRILVMIGVRSWKHQSRFLDFYPNSVSKAFVYLHVLLSWLTTTDFMSGNQSINIKSKLQCGVEIPVSYIDM